MHVQLLLERFNVLFFLADGEWQYNMPSVLKLGTEPVASLLLVGSHVWAACGQHIHLIHQVAAPDSKEVKYEQVSQRILIIVYLIFGGKANV